MTINKKFSDSSTGLSMSSYSSSLLTDMNFPSLVFFPLDSLLFTQFWNSAFYWIDDDPMFAREFLKLLKQLFGMFVVG